MTDLGLGFLIGVPFAIIFLITRGIEGHFGGWSEITFGLMLLAPTFILLIIDNRKRHKRRP